jgi:hypothetical protein
VQPGANRFFGPGIATPNTGHHPASRGRIYHINQNWRPFDCCRKGPRMPLR